MARRKGRLTNKRSDRRYRDSSGTIWASKFEFKIYDALRRNGVPVERCTESDSLRYTTPVSGGGRCLECGSSKCVQERIYTADLRVPLREGGGWRLIETKGHFPANKRSLFRHLRNAHPDVDICFVLGANHWVTKGKSRLSDYFARYLKTTPFLVVNPKNIDVDALTEFVCEPSQS